MENSSFKNLVKSSTHLWDINVKFLYLFGTSCKYLYAPPLSHNFVSLEENLCLLFACTRLWEQICGDRTTTTWNPRPIWEKEKFMFASWNLVYLNFQLYPCLQCGFAGYFLTLFLWGRRALNAPPVVFYYISYKSDTNAFKWLDNSFMTIILKKNIDDVKILNARSTRILQSCKGFSNNPNEKTTSFYFELLKESPTLKCAGTARRRKKRT